LTQDVGTRVAARSREVASDLRSTEQSPPDSTGTAPGSGADRDDSPKPSRPREGTPRPPATPGL
jgi:hypothetical protein